MHQNLLQGLLKPRLLGLLPELLISYGWGEELEFELLTGSQEMQMLLL